MWWRGRADNRILCHYECGRLATTKDHVIPKSIGGPSSNWNLVPACAPCNHGKGNQYPTHDCRFCKQARAVWTALKNGHRKVPLFDVDIKRIPKKTKEARQWQASDDYGGTGAETSSG